MAATDVGTMLTEAHRRQQLALNEATLRDVLRVWPAFDPKNIDESWNRLSPLLEVLAQSRRSQSAALSAGYYRTFRLAEGITGAYSVELAAALAAEELAGSLLYTGPITAKKLSFAGAVDVSAKTFSETAGNMTRLVLNGGRETITRTTQADPQALGWARVTDGNPCAFCAMLASRGANYASEGAADFNAHLRCGCHAEPVFTADQPTPGRADEFAALWTESTQGLSGRKARQAFRRAYEAR